MKEAASYYYGWEISFNSRICYFYFYVNLKEERFNRKTHGLLNMAESLFCDVIVFCLHGGPLENLVGFHLFRINCAAFSVIVQTKSSVPSIYFIIIAVKIINIGGIDDYNKCLSMHFVKNMYHFRIIAINIT